MIDPTEKSEPDDSPRAMHCNLVNGSTPQQSRIVAALAEGLSNRGIAASLGVSQRTVESHLATIFDKLGVCSRAAVLACLLEQR